MVVLIDADSLIYSSCLNVEDRRALGVLKFDEVFHSIINKLEETWQIEEIIVFNGARGNYRKILDPTYKANRTKPKPILLPTISKYVKDNYNSKQAYGMETDDLVAIYWNKLQKEIGRNNVIIVSIDKDYKQLPALIYNYHSNSKKVFDISEEEAIHNFHAQMIIGDSADNINFCKGYGVKYTQKLFKDCKTKYQYIKETFKLFKKIYKSKAREKYILCYKLLKLRTE